MKLAQLWQMLSFYARLPWWSSVALVAIWVIAWWIATSTGLGVFAIWWAAVALMPWLLVIRRYLSGACSTIPRYRLALSWIVLLGVMLTGGPVLTAACLGPAPLAEGSLVVAEIAIAWRLLISFDRQWCAIGILVLLVMLVIQPVSVPDKLFVAGGAAALACWSAVTAHRQAGASGDPWSVIAFMANRSTSTASDPLAVHRCMLGSRSLIGFMVNHLVGTVGVLWWIAILACLLGLIISLRFDGPGEASATMILLGVPAMVLIADECGLRLRQYRTLWRPGTTQLRMMLALFADAFLVVGVVLVPLIIGALILTRDPLGVLRVYGDALLLGLWYTVGLILTTRPISGITHPVARGAVLVLVIGAFVVPILPAVDGFTIGRFKSFPILISLAVVTILGIAGVITAGWWLVHRRIRPIPHA